MINLAILNTDDDHESVTFDLKKPVCRHNNRYRWTNGFHCRDCDTFFPKDSSTYRSDELLCSIWMVLNNINVELGRAGEAIDQEVAEMKELIGIDKIHNNYEDLISQAEIVMERYKKTADSATIPIEL